MFCPGCGERDDQTNTCCTKCGLDLVRIRQVIAEGDGAANGGGISANLSDEAILFVSSTVPESKTEGSEPADSVETASPGPAAFDSSDPVLLKERGNELFRQGKFMDALDCYEKALAIDQFYKEAWFNKSMVLKKIGRQDQSEVCNNIYKRLSAGALETRKNKQE